MASRRRFENETYEDYRAALKDESSKMVEYLKGHFVHLSSCLVPSSDEKHKNTPERLRPLVKVRQNGTFRKERK